MNIEVIKIIILKTPGSSRYLPLHNSLRHDERFDLMYIKSTMASTIDELDNKNIMHSQKLFKSTQQRLLFPREIACAWSHNNAREVIAFTESGGIILEDDARISDLDALYCQVKKFLIRRAKTKSVLNLSPFYDINYSKNNSKTFLKISGVPNLAVAYALTPQAALDLLHNNNPVSYVADWPLNDSNFYILSNPIIEHGDSMTSSTILDGKSEFRNGLSLRDKFLIYSFINFFRFGFREVSIMDYIKLVFFRKIYWHFDIFKVKVRIQLKR